MDLIFSNKPSLLNKKLVQFFKLNLLNLNKASLVFKFEVAHPKDSDKYTHMGIKNYPVLIPKGIDPVTGVDAIISFLKKYVDNYNNKITNKTDEDRLEDFWNKTLDIKIDSEGKHKPADDDDDDEDNGDLGADLQHKIQTAFAERSKSTESPKKKNNRQQSNTVMSRDNNIEDDSPSTTLKNMSKKGHSSIDDDLMANFFENQEETK
jgi:hypothetical protein